MKCSCSKSANLRITNECITLNEINDQSYLKCKHKSFTSVDNDPLVLQEIIARFAIQVLSFQLFQWFQSSNSAIQILELQKDAHFTER